MSIPNKMLNVIKEDKKKKIDFVEVNKKEGNKKNNSQSSSVMYKKSKERYTSARSLGNSKQDSKGALAS